MRSYGLASVVGAVVFASAAQAAPLNLLGNGSFESGSGSAGSAGSFTGWTVGGSTMGVSPGAGPQRITYGAGATAYGDTVPADPFTSSPDASGTKAAYFVDDAARETLSQSIAITAGTTYEVGFDFFETNTGAANPNPFSLTASLNGTTLATIASSDPAYVPTGTWYHVFELFTAANAGNSGFVFSYLSGAYTAKDVIVDDVYVETAPAADVPEPASFAMLGLGLCALTALGWRARRFG